MYCLRIQKSQYPKADIYLLWIFSAVKKDAVRFTLSASGDSQVFFICEDGLKLVFGFLGKYTVCDIREA